MQKSITKDKSVEVFDLARKGKLSSIPPNVVTLSEMLDPRNGKSGVCPLEACLESVLVNLDDRAEAGNMYNPSVPASNMEEQVVHWILDRDALCQKNAKGDSLLEFLHRYCQDPDGAGFNERDGSWIEFDGLLQIDPESDIPRELSYYFSVRWWEDYEVSRGADMGI